MSRKILVAGVGNIFLGDDGFGVEVARALSAESFPENVTVSDFGIRGVHLAYQLLEGYDTLVLVDAARRGEPPGTVFVIEPDFTKQPQDDAEEDAESGFLMDAHSMDPELVLGILENLGGKVERVVIVGCEPESLEEKIGLSDSVAAAVPLAARAVREIVENESPSAVALG
jgi:hydrogenase maturation protease